jgi:acetylornithine deacetylase/succinyl-diaminopimelate desuccinylase-like protein
MSRTNLSIPGRAATARWRAAVLSTLGAVFALAAHAQTTPPTADLATGYLRDLLRLDTSNPPGDESKVARYLKTVADQEGIPAELLGDNPARLNFIARLKGNGKQRPLLLMAHSDVVPVERAQWTVEPFAAVEKEGYIYGRGTEDTKNLLAAELAVLVELKRSKAVLDRDIILVSESDEEAGSGGIKWLVANAWPKIDAEFALNEFSYSVRLPSGVDVYQIQTAEKIPTRIRLTARGVAGHGSLPREDNAVTHLARAIVKLTDAPQPVALNETTRAYFKDISQLTEFAALRPLLARLEDPAQSDQAVAAITRIDPEFGAMLHFSLSPTMLSGGVRINVIPNSVEALLDGRRLPTENPDDVFTRLQKIVNDPAVTVQPAERDMQPSTAPSSLETSLYKAMAAVFHESSARAVVVPFMMRGTTDGAYLRAKGMPVYGVPIFHRDGELRMHGNDERISLENLRFGTDMLRKVVARIAVSPLQAAK